MNEIIATTTVQFLSHIKDHGETMMFRGQGNEEWPLTPSIARYSSNVQGPPSIWALEELLLSNFRQFGMPFADFRKLSKIEQLIHAQHYGLPTRLLDWSSNPLKALFFAVEDCALDQKNAAVFITKHHLFNNGTGAVSTSDSTEHLAFSPEIFHERITAQDACFLSFPLSKESMEVPALSAENLPKNMAFLEKILIPAQYKKELRKQLAILGITHKTIYPGLEGTTRWIRSKVSNYSV